MSTGRELVWLTHGELLLLDGRVSTEVQDKIDKVRNTRDYGKDKAFILEVTREGNAKGEIGYREGYVTCEVCGARSEIVNYKSGSRRGNMNWKESTRIAGVSFAKDFVTLQGHPRLGICDKCHERIKQDLQTELRRSKFDYHDYLSDCPYRRDAQRKCFKCSKTMFESEMGKEPTIIGRGTYPATCPHCGAKLLLFGKIHGTTGGWRIVERQKEKVEGGE